MQQAEKYKENSNVLSKVKLVKFSFYFSKDTKETF
jgi:hypothetical protein